MAFLICFSQAKSQRHVTIAFAQESLFTQRAGDRFLTRAQYSYLNLVVQARFLD